MAEDFAATRATLLSAFRSGQGATEFLAADAVRVLGATWPMPTRVIDVASDVLLAEVLQQNPTRNVLVEGFTDSTGADPYNQQLSERRGQTVRDALLQMGVGSERISVRGYGESYPVASNDTAANRQLNRRVEIVLSDESGKTPQR